MCQSIASTIIFPFLSLPLNKYLFLRYLYWNKIATLNPEPRSYSTVLHVKRKQKTLRTLKSMQLEKTQRHQFQLNIQSVVNVEVLGSNMYMLEIHQEEISKVTLRSKWAGVYLWLYCTGEETCSLTFHRERLKRL